MNKLFYHNVERGNFISMIYAVIDLDARTVCIARAGHNPVLLLPAGRRAETILSKGLALGFERGEKFAATIEEFTQPLREGDVFVFYTDGFPEAMSKTREEYGEQRMIGALQARDGSDATGYLEALFADTARFTHKAVQHDDMTVVIVKVTA
jgi:sigma-B regulation protein RsbU (phosphoserine phosphatase)